MTTSNFRMQLTAARPFARRGRSPLALAHLGWIEFEDPGRPPGEPRGPIATSAPPLHGWWRARELPECNHGGSYLTEAAMCRSR